MLIIGDRSTGKTTIAIDTIINQANINNQHRKEDGSFEEGFRPVYSIYVAVGQKNSNIARTINVLEKAGALEYTIIVCAPAADNPANQYIAPFSGAPDGEYWRNGMDALIVMMTFPSRRWLIVRFCVEASVRSRGVSRGCHLHSRRWSVGSCE